ncbi:ATP-binding protein [Stenotrophomonas sp. HITSZ_GD]|uniref:ATP-binding protein n=1 Tax=Stenotrophomonas sp. HITSZ_GD TaxID=3037248 RepID=UPI00240CF86F|nr:ATP-binding protein [Stenotrophomonas sp. HITSZ_GD]MDG2524601.1 ATP-binding protein [Stenotrophomonas sp. HITSZ_GD]
MNVIDASPTKDFFISIITRDISLLDAAKDLVDNCIDGARRLRPGEAASYEGLHISIELSETHFAIADNCGGIQVSVAREYAFRFGRPADAPVTDGSIGQFGVGMKRALFKMGNNFEIQSKAPDSHFLLEVNVHEWRTRKDEKGRDDWTFEFKEAIEGETRPPDECSTTIVVTDLHPPIAAEFATERFKTTLIRGIQEAHARSLDAGLEITVNNHQLTHNIAMLLQSGQLKPIRIVQSFPANPAQGIRRPVLVNLYAGVAESNIDEAGWYIVCNGRQIVRADKSALTGWGAVFNEITVPKVHNQFSRFRGYVFFESDDAQSLPWNTAKSGVDEENSIFQFMKGEMVAALRQVIDFLNALDAELDTDSTHLRDVVAAARPVRLSMITESRSFYYPQTGPAHRPKTVRIQYDRAVEDVDWAKDFFGVKSARQVGELAFEYVWDREH